MSNIRRFYVPDSIVFITTVTKNQQPLLISPDYLRTFWFTVERVQNIHPFDLIAYVILPDHFHWLIRPRNELSNFSSIMHSFKRNFTVNVKKILGNKKSVRFSQSGFWDHVIQSENDFKNHLTYIHWNPVKHGYVEEPEEWPHSSYANFQ